MKDAKPKYVSPWDIYRESGKWKCEQSPTGAHFFLVYSNGKAERCKYCKERREIALTRYDRHWRQYPKWLISPMVKD